jgi:hypothetical protein
MVSKLQVSQNNFSARSYFYNLIIFIGAFIYYFLSNLCASMCLCVYVVNLSHHIGT